MLEFHDLTDVKCCHVTYKKMNDTEENLMVTEWWNCEGFDIILGDDERRISLDLDDINAVFAAILSMDAIDLQEIVEMSDEIKDKKKEKDEFIKKTRDF